MTIKLKSFTDVITNAPDFAPSTIISFCVEYDTFTFALEEHICTVLKNDLVAPKTVISSSCELAARVYIAQEMEKMKQELYTLTKAQRNIIIIHDTTQTIFSNMVNIEKFNWLVEMQPYTHALVTDKLAWKGIINNALTVPDSLHLRAAYNQEDNPTSWIETLWNFF